MISKNGKVQDKKFKVFEIKHFDEKLLLNDSSFLSNLKNTKTNTILIIKI